MLDDVANLADLLNFYKESSLDVMQQLDLFQRQYDNLRTKNIAEMQKPDFQLKFPQQLTKKVYQQVTNKIFAVIRHLVYYQVRHIVRNRKNPQSQDKYITKNEMKDILSALDTVKIR